ncbi:TetR/AcrR family transcriptional regulator [Oscillochloris sp. ZM17-4]|uniref:TetR/AcrR family transcriptional regulator n=1 Tax=Oscillochloris sp. ZM17-4 TaxID=2866714 RepID=UPI001C73C24E|nr:TetR/AcrR family transcriptional regulator [Oscillochloris sp. ZM17-4]MBX0331227.1 TetR/AcrR family transcriptional regulator [Oscillochloris sp. ZM17-4]
MTTRRQEQKAATARRIFAAAIALFREQGFAATTVEQITQAAGVAKGTFFTHFASKELLLDHIGQIQMERIAAATAADPAFAQRGARERLRLVIRTLAAGIASQPAEMRALTVEILARRSIFEVDRQGIGALDSLLAQIIADGQAAGELRADAPPEQVAALTRSAYFMALFDWVRDEGVGLPARADSYLDMLFGGIATP